MWEFLKGTPIPDQSWEIRHGSPHFYGRFGGLLVAEWISQSHSNLGFDLAAKQSILTTVFVTITSVFCLQGSLK